MNKSFDYERLDFSMNHFYENYQQQAANMYTEHLCHFHFEFRLMFKYWSRLVSNHTLTLNSYKTILFLFMPVTF